MLKEVSVKSGSSEVFARDDVATEERRVPIGSLIADPQAYAFRDDGEYKKDNKSIAALAEDIRLAGLLTPLLVQQQGEKYLVLDGHRRHCALNKLVDDGNLGAESTVPAHVIVGEVSKLELLLRLGAANINRKQWDDMGEIEFAKALANQNCPKTEIARVLQKSEKQVDRYVLIANNGWMLKHVREHNINASRAAGLLALADKYDRKAEFRDEFEAWVKRVKLDLEDENRRRRRNDQEELSGDKLWPQKQLKPEVVEAWTAGIKTRHWGEPTFKFKALINTDAETGRKKIEIDSLKVDLAKLSLEDTVKVYRRCQTLASDLEPVLLDKKQRAATVTKTDGTTAQDVASRRLAELGLDGIVDEEPEIDGEDDDDFDQTETRQEEDLASTVELPDDDVDADEDADPDESDEDEEDRGFDDGSDEDPYVNDREGRD